MLCWLDGQISQLSWVSSEGGIATASHPAKEKNAVTGKFFYFVFKLSSGQALLRRVTVTVSGRGGMTDGALGSSRERLGNPSAE